MKESTVTKLFAAWDYCNEHDKSTEFMLQYMQDVSGCDLDTVLKFIKEKSKYKNPTLNQPQP